MSTICTAVSCSGLGDENQLVALHTCLMHFNPDLLLIRYECDDKCGSFWQKLPVNETGRDTKEEAKAKYAFSIHANVMCGQNGVCRFTLVPKNVTCGADFGLTNLLITLLAAKRRGQLEGHVDHLYRHTDGGPDNVAIVVHFIHWLMVYLGIFNKITWFRFPAGHSHTEIADRLFSIMKKLFVSDSASRVLGIQDIPQLIDLLKGEFSDLTESFEFAFNFANWGLTSWAESLNVIGTLKHIKHTHCFVYSYDIANWQHGGVTVQYKKSIAWKGTWREAELSPIERETQLLPDAQGELAETEVNVSNPNGLRFIVRPPDLRREPPRAKLDEEKTDPASLIAKLLKTAAVGDLSPAAVSFWGMLKKLHGKHGQRAETLPELPYTAHAEDGRQFTFNGTPQPFKRVVSELMLRFERPLLSKDPFSSAPFESFQAAHDAFRATPQTETGVNRAEEVAAVDVHAPLRDPRTENTVVHEDFSEAARKRGEAEAARDNFCEDQDDRVTEVKLHQLYFVELAHFEEDVKLGLCEVTKEDKSKQEWTVSWFRHARARNRRRSAWSVKNPVFEPHLDKGKRATDTYSIEVFRLEVKDRDLTAGSRKNRDDKPAEFKPKLTDDFAQKVAPPPTHTQTQELHGVVQFVVCSQLLKPEDCHWSSVQVRSFAAHHNLVKVAVEAAEAGEAGSEAAEAAEAEEEEAGSDLSDAAEAEEDAAQDSHGGSDGNLDCDSDGDSADSPDPGERERAGAQGSSSNRSTRVCK